MSNVSISEGYWFYFQDGGDIIAIHGSGWSGMESVYINDELIAQKRSLRLKSEHKFRYKEKEYSVLFHVTSFIKIEVSCTLTIDGRIAGTESKAFVAKGNTSFFKHIIILFILGAAAGFLSGMFLFSSP